MTNAPFLANVDWTPDRAGDSSSRISDIEHDHMLQWSAESLAGRRWTAMARLVNAWEWFEGTGQGGECPHRHPDGWIRVSDEYCIQVVQGPATGRWYVVKCRTEQLTARSFSGRLHSVGVERAVPKRMQRNPHDGSRYEQTWLWIEPEELHDAGPSADDALDLAHQWRSQLCAEWALEAEGWGQGNEIAVSPERMGFLQRALNDDDGTGAIDAVLDRLAEVEEAAAEEAQLDRA